MTTRTLVAGLAAIAAVTAVTATAVAATSTSSSAAEEPTVLTFTTAEKGLTQKYVDVGRKGESLGDRYLTGFNVEQDGEVAGRVLVECLSLDAAYGAQTCELSVQLADGTLYLRGMGFHRSVPNVGRGSDEVYAVTGGSGAYAGARGEASTPSDSGTTTVTLLP